MAELTSWKEIAAYLHCSVRTVQRWEKERGLPVRRIPGERGAVYALTSELEQWKLSGQAPKPDEEDPELLAAEARDSGSAQEPTVVNRAHAPSRPPLRLIGAVAFVAAVVGGVVLWIGAGATRAAIAPGPILLGPTAIMVGGLQEAPWPIRAGDARRTNRSLQSGPKPPLSVRLVATYSTTTPDEAPHVIDDIVVDRDGRFTVGGCGHLEMFDGAGTRVWSHRFKDESWDTERPTGLAILASGVLVLGSRGCPHDVLHTRRTRAYAFLPNGQSLWLQMQGGVDHSPAVWPNGHIAWIDEFNTVRGYNSAGAIQWTTDLAGFSHGGIAVDLDGNAIVGTDAARYGHRSLWSLSPEGRIRWNNGDRSIGTPAIDDLGRIYVTKWPKGLASYSSDGTERWTIEVDDFAPDALITIGQDRVIYFRSSGSLWSLTDAGERRWVIALPADDFPAGAILDADGMLFIAARNEVVAVTRDGHILWRQPVRGALRVVPGGAGKLLVMTRNRGIVAIQSSPRSN